MELKPCPFCGEDEATFEYVDVIMDGDRQENCGVRCGYCGIMFFTFGKKDQMINDWNTRQSGKG
jgi:Lar family restriction alleviation protein